MTPWDAISALVWFCGATAWLLYGVKKLMAWWQQYRFTGRPQFTEADKRVEIARWRQYTQAILREPVDGYHHERSGRPVLFEDVLNGINVGNSDAISAMEDIRRRGYISRRLTLVGWLNARMPPDPDNPNCSGRFEP